MKRMLFSVLPLCLWLQAPSWAQAWRSYTNINPIRQVLSEGGALWAATEGGVFSFSSPDSSLIGVYTNVDGLPSTDVRAVAVDHRRRLYFGTAGAGLAILDSSRSRFSRITARDHNIISDTVNAVLCHGDYVFLGSPGGLSFYNGGSWRTYSNRIYDIGEEVRALAYGRDTLWIGHDHGVTAAPISAVLNAVPGQWRYWADVGSTLNDVNYIYIADTTVFLCFNDGVSRRLLGTWYKLPGSGNYGVNVTRMAIRRDTFYLSTEDGFFKYTESSGRIDISSGLPSRRVASLCLTDDSTLWAGTAEGLARWGGAVWKPFRQNCLPSNAVGLAAAGPDGSIWLAHGGQYASRISPGGAVSVYQTPFPGIPMTALAADDSGNAWYGLAWGDASGRSCFRIDPQGGDTVFGLPLLPPMCGVYDIVREVGNRLYFAMRYHNVPNYVVKRWPDGSYQWISDPNPPGTYLKPMALSVDASGALWVGTLELGLYRYDPGTGGWANLRKDGGLSENNVTGLAVDQADAVWASTESGLNRCLYDRPAGLLKVDAFYTSANSQMLGDNVRSVAVDRSGNRWIATDRGLSMLSWDGRWTGYTSGDAFSNGSRILCDDVRRVAVRPRDASGDDILIATPRGLSVYSHYAPAEGTRPRSFAAPNPFRPGRDRILMFSNLPDRAEVSLHALDGRLVAAWLGPAAPSHILTVDASTIPGGLPSGLYLCRIRPAAGKPQVIKLAVVR